MKKSVLLTILAGIMAVMISCGDDKESTLGSNEACSGNFPNEHDSICWSDKSAEGMTWEEAITYCLNMGGRLPTINELRTLIINCPGSTAGGACKVSDPECLSYNDCWSEDCYCDGSAASYSALGDNKDTTLWSSSEPSGKSSNAWRVAFGFGHINAYYKIHNYAVRCARPDH